MAITESFLYGLSVEKMLKGTMSSLDDEDHKGLLVNDSYAPNTDTHDFHADITNEVSGSGYTAGGNALTTTAITVGSPAAGQIKYDVTNDPSWTTSTIPAAMAHIGYDGTVGTSAANPLIFLQDFVTAVTSSNGTLTIQIHANGVFYIDYKA